MLFENEHWRSHTGTDANFDLVPHLGAAPYRDVQPQAWLDHGNPAMKQDNDDMQMLWSVPESKALSGTGNQMRNGGPDD
jgi:hypothetical protein